MSRRRRRVRSRAAAAGRCVTPPSWLVYCIVVVAICLCQCHLTAASSSSSSPSLQTTGSTSTSTSAITTIPTRKSSSSSRSTDNTSHSSNSASVGSPAAAAATSSTSTATTTIVTSSPSSPSRSSSTGTAITPLLLRHPPAGAAAASDQTCESRAINYITHRLPKQCLEIRWRTSSTDLPSASRTVASENARHKFKSHDSASQPHGGQAQSSQESLSRASAVVDSASFSSSIPIAATSSSSSDATSTTASDGPSHSSPLPSSIITLENSDQQSEDSPLDNAKFLSFEEWKKANLAQAGQSAETLGHVRASSGHGQPRQRPAGNNNGLDSLGEDSEIELDFSGFGPSADSDTQQLGSNGKPIQHGGQEPSTAATAGQPIAAAAPYLRSKDAGVTCKERFNYASFDCAANVLKTNPRCKNPSSILVENKDSYMLNECSVENKFLIVELCDDILIDTVVLANFEFFSSMFRSFRVSVSDRYPVKAEKWKELGTFEARNTREIQAFLVENPLVWARYLRVEFLAHYGSEFYCPLSLLRVHGTTMMEEFRNQEALARGDIDPEDEETSLVALGMGNEQVDKDVLAATSQPMDEKALARQGDKSQAQSDQSPPPEAPQNPSEPSPAATGSSQSASADDASDALQVCAVDGPGAVITEQTTSTHNATSNATSHDKYTCAMEEAPIASVSQAPPSLSNSTSQTTAIKSPDAKITTKVPSSFSNGAGSSGSSSGQTQQRIPPHHRVDTFHGHTSGNASASPDSRKSWANDKDSLIPHHPPPSTPSAPSLSQTSITTSTILVATAISPTSSPASATASPPSTAHTAQPPASPPATQESFFKSISKRLQILESNATLSLQYIEAQSQLLRDAFGKVEKRQLNKTLQFLETLNRTVLSELSRFKGEYEQLWQSTVLELASQREEGRRERELLGERVRMLAEEMVSQKRLMSAQATLLLLCLGLVVFGKLGGPGNNSDVGFVAGMQDMIRRSRSSRRRNVFNRDDTGDSIGSSKPAGAVGGSWQWDNQDHSNSSPWASPPHTPLLTRPSTSHGRSLSRETSQVAKELQSLGLEVGDNQEEEGGDDEEEEEEDRAAILVDEQSINNDGEQHRGIDKQKRGSSHRRNLSNTTAPRTHGEHLLEEDARLQVPSPPARANSSPCSFLSPVLDGNNCRGSQEPSSAASSPRRSPNRKKSSQHQNNHQNSRKGASAAARSAAAAAATTSPNSPLAITATATSTVVVAAPGETLSMSGTGTPLSGGSLDGFDMD